ncbi:DNA-binding MarR family transcriptional regulator [Mucilaginibacter frigoritolerans]|jgi:DNA-binding MarR family transcriptional regulator|uniref:DNA-binding MarR family transcriptional regulator n=1 Tax=Mucilaginibacter frigoritolerans TaxID=652788 RepID=A0A562U6N4_9SPHI|nr:MarR family transcriptional regulator [Mucilaginibacter frigoritolerans]TWJ01473.1 DNA-binding MarR family transcriptional regulator [Mucilaginibacter frigoritolerans]
MEKYEAPKVLPKLVYLLKRSLEDWIETGLCCSCSTDFNKAQLPLFMSIGTNGISNSKLASNLNVSKQAASKVIKELEELDLVRSEKCSTDGRSMLLSLTDNGIQLYNHISNQMQELEKEYKKIVGTKNYETAIDVMQKLINYHEEHAKIALN